MSKVYGLRKEFALVRLDASRTIIGYGLCQEDEEHATWHEVYFYKKMVGTPSFAQVKKAILADIDAQTDERILNGYEFTPDGADTPIVVWLSRENQTNFSEAQRLAIVPITFKLNEDEEQKAIYHTFADFDELDRFYKGGVAYIQQCLQQGWARKDAIDWAPYRALFPDEQPSTPDDEPPTPDNSQAITPDGQN